MKTAINGDTAYLSVLVKLLAVVDDPPMRQKLLYRCMGWTVAHASPCNENLCWLTSHVQAFLGTSLKVQDLLKYRVSFQAFCKFLLSFGKQALWNMFLFARDATGKPVTSHQGLISDDVLFATVLRRSQGHKLCTSEGGTVELALVAAYFGCELNVHSLTGTEDGLPRISINAQRESVSIVTPLSSQAGHCQHQLHSKHIPGHFDTILGPCNKSLATGKAAEFTPEKVLADAKARVQDLATCLSPASLQASLGSDFDEKSHFPVCPISAIADDSELRKAPDSSSSSTSRQSRGEQVEVLQQSVVQLSQTVAAQQVSLSHLLQLMTAVAEAAAVQQQQQSQQQQQQPQQQQQQQLSSLQLSPSSQQQQQQQHTVAAAVLRPPTPVDSSADTQPLVSQSTEPDLLLPLHVPTVLSEQRPVVAAAAAHGDLTPHGDDDVALDRSKSPVLLGGGASAKPSSSDVSDDQIKQAAAFAKILASKSGELFVQALVVPHDNPGLAFYEHEPTDSDPLPGYVAVEKHVSDALSRIALLTDSSGMRTKAAKAVIKRVAKFVGDVGSSSSGYLETPVPQQRKYLRDYEKLLKMVAPNFTLKKADIRDFFSSEAAADAAFSTSSDTVDLSGTSQ